MKKISLHRLVDFLDSHLELSSFSSDSSVNGLQIEGKNQVRKIGVAVDASEAVFGSARRHGIDFLFVHHGLIWGGIQSIRGIMRRRIKSLIDSEISLYACHLPLDAHPVLGNNARMLKVLKLRKMGPFGEYHGRSIGYWGRTGKALSLDDFVAQVDKALGTKSSSISFGRRVRNVGAVSGGGWFAINEAEDLGLDTLLTGEPAHSAYTLAEEMKVNLVFAGHYASETLGVRAVGHLLGKKFGLEVLFIDHPSGL